MFKKINLNTILIIALVIVAILYLKQCNTTSNLKGDIKIANMNRIAMLDSVTTYKDKNGSLVYEKSTLIASKKELKDLNNDLYKDIKSLKNNPKIVIKERIVVEHDTIKVPTTVSKYPDGSIGLNWKYDSTFSAGNFQKLSGETKFKYVDDSLNILGTSINQNTFGMSFVTGLTKGKDSYEIFIKSDYPGFSVSSIEGAIIDKSMIESDESAFVVGPSIGYGILFGSNGNINHGINVGFNVTYSLNKKIKKIFRPFGL